MYKSDLEKQIEQGYAEEREGCHAPFEASDNSDGLDVSCAGNGAVAAPGEAAEAGCASGAKWLECPVPSGAKPWDASGYLTDKEALRLLADRDSGVRPELSRRGYRFVKRAFDLVASGAAVALLLIPGAALCAVICAKSPGAGPLYSQWRIGRVRADGTYRPFRMWKFRSMVPNADEMLADLQGSNEADGPLFKIKEDPRVVPGVGAFIRKHSIDELPQLLNVLAGQMSLIGPRPGLPREVVQYDERAKRRLAVKPGCGGAWQVSGRSDIGFEQMVDLDLDYMHSRGIAKDLDLVVRTLGAMRSGKGAS
ncbi:MAG TPA: sugar transferase [Candidatus Rubneribacter avistercoris]|nr:sugar transferase [Candidatus Rubneribacter avistercoris]